MTVVWSNPVFSRDGAELSIEIPAEDGLTQYNVMQNIGWIVTNSGNMTSGRFQVQFNAHNGWAHHKAAGGYSNATFGQGSGNSNLPAGESIVNVDMSGFGEVGFVGKYRLNACIDPDYYSEEEGALNDADPSNNCAHKEIIVLDGDATDAKLIVNGNGPDKFTLHEGEMAKNIGFTVLNVGPVDSGAARVHQVIRPYSLVGDNTDPNIIDERKEYNYPINTGVVSGAEYSRKLISPLMRFAAGRWYINTCVYRKLADGTEERLCDTTRAFNVEKYVHDPERDGAELALDLNIDPVLVEGDPEIHRKILFNIKNTGNMTTGGFRLYRTLRKISPISGGQTSWGGYMGAANFPAGHDGDYQVLGSSSQPSAGLWAVYGCIDPASDSLEEAELNDANGSNNCVYREIEIAEKQPEPEPEPEPIPNVDPVASFSAICEDLKCSLDASASSDSDGNIVSYKWDFGDGAVQSSALKTVSKIYASAGEYLIKLTVTDDDGATNSTSKYVQVKEPIVEPPEEPQEITLSVSSKKLRRGQVQFSLSWVGATSNQVDILRDGRKISTTANDGKFSESLKGKKPYFYKVCESGTSICSESVATGY
jgi:hypothetical protein